MAEREPLFRIGERGFECALRNAASLRAYADPATIKGGQCYFIALSFISDAIRGGHFAIREDELGACRRADTKFLLFLANLEARRPSFHHQRCNAFLAFRRIGVDVD